MTADGHIADGMEMAGVTLCGPWRHMAQEAAGREQRAVPFPWEVNVASSPS